MKLRRMRWARHVVIMGEDSKMYKVLVRKPMVKRPLRRPRHRFYGMLKTLRSMKEIIRRQYTQPFHANIFLLRYHTALLVTAREL
jgi:hypothetical protein